MMDSVQARKRIKVLKMILESLREKGDDQNIAYVRNGVIPPALEHDFESLMKTIGESDHSPLSFDELTCFNTWFFLHPEKVAGKESLTTSLHFPVTVRGKRQDVISTLEKGMNQSQRVRIAKVKAQAKLKMLELLTI